jgi:hypothetical protein
MFFHLSLLFLYLCGIPVTCCLFKSKSFNSSAIKYKLTPLLIQNEKRCSTSQHIICVFGITCLVSEKTLVFRNIKFYVLQRFRKTSSSYVKDPESCAGIFKQSIGARNQVGIGLSYRPARLRSLAELVPWNRFLGSLKV